jgi:hypothetical protein
MKGFFVIEDSRPSPGVSRRGRNITIALLCVALVLTIARIVSIINPGNYVIIEYLFVRPFVAGVLILVLLAAACWLGLRGKSILRATGTVLALMAAASWLCLGLISLWFSDETEVDRVPSPGGGSLEVRVIQDSGALTTTVLVRKYAGLLSREWHLACFSADPVNSSVAPTIDVQWVDERHVQLQEYSSTFDFTFDAKSGRPDKTKAC